MLLTDLAGLWQPMTEWVCNLHTHWCGRYCCNRLANVSIPPCTWEGNSVSASFSMWFSISYNISSILQIVQCSIAQLVTFQDSCHVIEMTTLMKLYIFLQWRWSKAVIVTKKTRRCEIYCKLRRTTLTTGKTTASTVTDLIYTVIQR